MKGRFSLKLIPAETEEHLLIVRELFVEYAESLGFDLGFQDFQDELADLPGDYAQPKGALMLAIYEGEIAGCVGMRRFAEGVCEMKRMYVRPEFRGRSIGRAMSQAMIEAAKRAGYKTMRLDTLSTMVEAISIYRSQGFKTIEPYRCNPIEGAVYLELDLE